MNRKIYYAALGGLCLIGLILSLVFFPFYNPLSLMFYYNREYAKSYQRYEQLYESKDHSIAVVVPLVWLNLQYARTGEAIRVMQDYVKENPLAADAVNYLGQILLSADRPYSYLATLPKAYELQPTLDNIREQATYYSFYNQPVKETEALQTLIDHYKGYQSEYQTLAYLYAKHRQKEKALQVIEKLLGNYPISELEESSVTIAMSIYLENGKKSEAIDLAKNFIQAHPKSDWAADVASVFQARGMNQEALAVLHLIPRNQLSQTEVLSMETSILVDQGKTAEAYALLKSYFDVDKLPEELYDNLVTFGLKEEKDPRILQNIVRGPNVAVLSDGTLIKVLEKAYTKRLPELAKNIQQGLPQQRLERDPVLKFALEMSSRGPITPEDLNFYLHPTMQELDDTQKLELAEIYYLIKLKSISKDTLQALGTYSDIPDNRLLDLADLLVNVNLTDEGLQKMEQIKGQLTGPESQIDTAWIVLLSASGKDQEAADWVQQHVDELDDTSLETVARVALSRKNPQAALVASRELLSRKKNNRAKRLHAEALVLAGRTEEGLDFLREQAEKGIKAVKTAYLYALGTAAKELPKYSEELKNYVAKQLALPNLRVKERRELGYSMVDAGMKEEALPIFFELAKNKPFNDPDTQALIGLFGEKLTPEQANWVASRARLSEGKEKAEWIKLLADTDNAIMVVDLVDPQDLDDVVIADIYLDALVVLKEDEKISAYLEEYVPKEKDFERLKKLAKLAYDEGLNKQAEEIYELVLDKEPNDKDGLKNLAILYFGDGIYSSARCLLGKLLAEYQSDYLSNFYYAELLKLKCDREYFWFYYKAIEQVDEAPYDEDEVVSQQLVKAQAQNGVRNLYGSMSTFWELLWKNPNNKDVRTTFGDLLMDYQFLCMARYVLFAPSSVPEKEAPKGISDFKDTVSYEIAKARYFKETLQMCKAYQYSNWLLNEYPDEASVYAYRSSLDQNIGRWRSALNYICCARQIEPQNEAYWQTTQDIINEQPAFIGVVPEIVQDRRPYIAGEWEYRKTGTIQKEHFWRAGADYLLEPYSKFNILFERDRLDARDVTLKSGVTENFKGFRKRVRLSYTYDFLCGGAVSPSLYFAKTIFGGGIDFTPLDYYGIWHIAADYRYPYWEYPETIIQHGTLDRVTLGRTQRLTPFVEANLEMELRHYSLKGVNGAAKSVVARGYLNKALDNHNPLVRIFGEETSIVLSYGLDAEYPYGIRMRLDPFATPFAPLPVIRREEHSLQIVFAKLFCRDWRLQCNGGYTYDRFGLIRKPSPIGGAQLSYIKRPGLNFTLFYDHSQSNQSTMDTVDRWLVAVSLFY